MMDYHVWAQAICIHLLLILIGRDDTHGLSVFIGYLIPDFRMLKSRSLRRVHVLSLSRISNKLHSNNYVISILQNCSVVGPLILCGACIPRLLK